MLSRAAVMVVAAAAVIGLNACRSSEAAAPSATEDVVRYVALGDSYTIGTSVAASERWPNQLVARLATGPSRLELVANLGVNGYTSADLIRDELPRLDELEPEFVSVLIGVNDVVQGVAVDAYGANVARILDDLARHLPTNRIVCVATPDYTVTPRGRDYGDPSLQSAGIAEANEILRSACAERGIAFVPEIFELSRAAATDRSLVADDGLHPSGAQYERWVEAIEPVVRALLAD